MTSPRDLLINMLAEGQHGDNECGSRHLHAETADLYLATPSGQLLAQALAPSERERALEVQLRDVAMAWHYNHHGDGPMTECETDRCKCIVEALAQPDAPEAGR